MITLRNPKFRKLLRNFLIELALYGALVLVYFLVVLRYLGGWLTEIYHTNLTLYAVVALVLIIAQGVLLEYVTTFLLDLFKVERID